MSVRVLTYTEHREQMRQVIEDLKQRGLEDARPDAFRPGERVVKCGTSEGDTHEDGAPATVVFSARSPKTNLEPGEAGLCLVEWDDAPGLIVGVSWHRLERLKGTKSEAP